MNLHRFDPKVGASKKDYAYQTPELVVGNSQVSCHNIGSNHDINDALKKVYCFLFCYLALREAEGADWDGLLIQLNLFNDEHLPIVVHSLADIAVFYQEMAKQTIIKIKTTYTKLKSQP